MNRSPWVRVARLFVIVLILVSSPITLAAAQDASTVTAQTVPTFTIRGTGWGHGIGMSQYGAQGAALAGKDHRWILGHYYTGTTIAEAAAKTVRVNLDAAANYATGGNSGYTKVSWRILSGQSGQSIKINGVTQPTGTYAFAGSGSNIVVTAPNGTKTTLSGTVTVTATGGSPALLQVVEGTGIYSLANARYRGSLQLTASVGKIKLINVLPMESYLYGVVPREVPSGWHAEALRAQAIAARSYGYPMTGDLYCTTLSQAYQGYGGYNSTGTWVGEAASTNAAVDATKNQVVLYGTRVVRTYFFSQSGGHTANVEDVWVPADGDLAAKAAQFPELRGVPDTYEHLANPSYSPWSPAVSYTGTQIADRLRSVSGVPASPAYVVGAAIERATTGHARYVTFRFSNGAKVQMTGDAVRSRLSLRSTAFRFTGFPIERIAGPNRYATAQQISIRAFPSAVTTVVIASGEQFADALSGSALAGAVAGPMLLTARTYLPDATAAELDRLKPTMIYLVGGTAAVDLKVQAAIAARRPDATIRRIAGIDRYETARKTADEVWTKKGSTGAILANGANWPDATAASALAYARSMPILLTPTNALDEQTRGYLSMRKPTTLLIAGSTVAISSGVEAAAASAAGTTPQRLAGANRYETAAEIARYTMQTSPAFVATDVYIATGVEYADALAGSMLAGLRQRPLILTYTHSCPSGTEGFLTQYDPVITRLYLFGGTPAVSELGYDALDQVMMR
ncbi:MAG: cell wall-binding repeat-containing protein [Coriobacteriia bacterium]